MKKLLIALISVVLLIVIAVSSVQLIPVMTNIDWSSLGGHFDKAEEKFSLSVSSDEGGTVSATEPQYTAGTVVDLVATPNEGYIFTGWYTGDDTYLTTSKNYSFAIDKDTVLRAGFVLAPESMEGEYNHFEELKNCSESFSFTIQCDKPDAETYLADNLTIVDSLFVGTEWEEQAKSAFVVERIGDTNEYKISLADNKTYDPGTTYTAYLPEDEGSDGVGTPDASFVELANNSSSMNFTIEQEETEVVEYNEGIVYLYDSGVEATDQVISIVDDGLTAGEEGDTPDYLILTEGTGVRIDTIFCVYYNVDENGDPVVDEESFFAKAESVEKLTAGRVKVVYGFPDLSEIFSELDIYTDGDIDLEDQGVEIDDETIQEIKNMVFSNETFHMYVANVYEAGEKALAGTGCEIEAIGKTDFVDLFDIKIVPKIKGNTASVDIGIAANIPIKKNGEQVAAISFQLNFNKELTITYGASIKLKYRWWLPVGVSSYDFWAGVKDKETISFAISAVNDSGTDGLGQLDENLDKEMSQLKSGKNLYFTKVKDAFEREGYKVENEKILTLFKVKYVAGIVSFNFDVNFFLRFNACVTLKYTASSYEDVKVGIRSGSGGSVKPYKSFNGSASTSDWLIAGRFDASVGLRVEAYISVTGLSRYIKAGLGVEAGSYIVLAGCGSINRGYFAAKLERGVYVKMDAYYKVFSLGGSWDLAEEKHSLFAYGYDDAIISYCDDKINGSTLSVPSGGLDLFELAKLKVNVMSVEDVATSIESLDLESDNYTVEVKIAGGEWLTYDAESGRLAVKSGAPLYFEDAITIKVIAKNNAWAKHTPGKTCVYLPEITINIECGDEDAYYNFIDNDMQKEFRKIFRNYNESSATLLKDNFKNIIDNAISVPAKYSGVFDVIAVEYVDRLFEKMKNYSALEDDNRTMENRFVISEADAFSTVFTYINSLIDGKTVDKLSTHVMLELTLDSEALYDTIISVAGSEDCGVLAENFQRVPAETKDAILEVMSEFLDNHKGSADAQRAEQLVNAFKTVIGFDEKESE